MLIPFLFACSAVLPTADRWAGLAPLVEAAIERGDTPNAVVLIVHRDEIVYRRAFGKRSVEPVVTPIQPDAVFDLASLTKPLATATAIHLLAARNKLALSDPVAKHWPEFGRDGKESITLRHLLLHTSGLAPGNPVEDYKQGREEAMKRIAALRLTQKPGEKFVYSDIGYIILGELVARVDGRRLDRFFAAEIAGPLGLTHTTYLPPATWADRLVPTTKEKEGFLLGRVHDPRAALLDGVAGHAGLFGSADDLAIYCRCLLNGGRLGEKQVFPAEVCSALTTAEPVPHGKRTLGWDVDTPYSGQRGTVWQAGTGFGHTGFTGTSIWVDPDSRTILILLAARLHPAGKGDIRRLRREIGTFVAEAVRSP